MFPLAADSVAWSASGDTSPPTQPGAIATSGLTANSVTLAWGASKDNVAIEGYRVYRGPAGAAAGALTLIATADAVTSYSATHLYSGRGYTFGIVAIDAANNQSPMRTVQVSTPGSSDSTPPAAPSSASVRVSVFSSSRIDVLWGASSSSDVAGYQVLRDGAVVGRMDLPGGLHYSDNGLAAKSTHSYAVRAVDSAGNLSAATTARSATTSAAGTAAIARGPLLSNVTATSAVVSWWTNIPTTGRIGYGVGSTGSNTATDPQGSVLHHMVKLSGLAPGTTYQYAVTSAASTGSSATRSASFSTAAPAGRTFSFAAIGDFGGASSGEQQNATAIAAAGTSFIQTLGDNVYPSSGFIDPNFATTYSDVDARFFKQFGTAVMSQPLLPMNGNKERYSDGQFWQDFPMLGANHAWYSYDWGNAHITVMDSEEPVDPASPQYAFLQQDLAAHASSTWRIVTVHKPPHSSTSANSSYKLGQQYLVPLFDQYHVQLVLSGNSHNYERSRQLKGGAVVSSGGTTYVVSGGGGSGFNAFRISQPSWSAFREATFFEFTKVTVSPTSLLVQGIRADTRAVFDSVTITG
ncbi:MAG TPA: fibronectin type III domain-containing protein [Kineosporiaceae bacterium]|nr:fibronectin type III domain-containing protein [Kineosporiaceae bacterium]